MQLTNQIGLQALERLLSTLLVYIDLDIPVEPTSHSTTHKIHTQQLYF